MASKVICFIPTNQPQQDIFEIIRDIGDKTSWEENERPVRYGNGNEQLIGAWEEFQSCSTVQGINTPRLKI